MYLNVCPWTGFYRILRIHTAADCKRDEDRDGWVITANFGGPNRDEMHQRTVNTLKHCRKQWLQLVERHSFLLQ